MSTCEVNDRGQRDAEAMEGPLRTRPQRLRSDEVLSLCEGRLSGEAHVQGFDARRVPPSASNVPSVRRVIGKRVPPDLSGPFQRLEACQLLGNDPVRIGPVHELDERPALQLIDQREDLVDSIHLNEVGGRRPAEQAMVREEPESGVFWSVELG